MEGCDNVDTDKIKKSIKRIGLKQRFIAEKIGVSESTLSHFLANRKDMPTFAKDNLYNLILKIDNITL